MKYKDFIKPGNRVIHDPQFNSLLTAREKFYAMYNQRPSVVTVGEYKPYYTDGTPDPRPDEYEGCCQVECYGDGLDDTQLRLETLLPIVPLKEKRQMIYDGKKCDVSLASEGEEYLLIGEDTVVYADDVTAVRELSDLSHDELMKLRKQIVVGSLYTADYHNTFGVDSRELLDCSDGYIEELEERFEGDWYDNDTPERFADYVTDGYMSDMEQICYNCKFAYLAGISHTDWRCELKNKKVETSGWCRGHEPTTQQEKP